jgi:hypothetical protein
MLYPAPGPAGLLAAVLTHGLLVEQSKAAQKEKLQEAADKVLDKYRSVVGSFTYGQLADAALAKPQLEAVPVASSQRVAGPWLLEGTPVLTMTQDQRALVLDVAFKITQPAGPASDPLVVRVVSKPLDPDGVADQWLAGDGTLLKAESATLLARAVRVAMNRQQFFAAPDAWQTVRYALGGSEQMERATVVEHDCGRLLLRNLRGAFMSVPDPSDGSRAADCHDPPASR